MHFPPFAFAKSFAKRRSKLEPKLAWLWQGEARTLSGWGRTWGFTGML